MVAAATTLPDPLLPPLSWIAAHREYHFLLSRHDVDAMVKAGVVPEDSTTELLNGVLLYVDRAAVGQPVENPGKLLAARGRPFNLKASEMSEGADHGYVVSGLTELSASISSTARHLRTQSSLICSDTHSPVPDGVVLRGSRLSFSGKKPTAADALCVVEVADSSYERDSGEKLFGYARAGIAQYIIINLRNRTAEVYTQPDTVAGTYALPLIILADGVLSLRVGDDEFFDVPLVDLLP